MAAAINQPLTHGLPAVVVAAALYGSAPVLQAASARRASPGGGLGLGLVARLVLQPLWLLGLAAGLGAFAIKAYAFSVAPPALVAPSNRSASRPSVEPGSAKPGSEVNTS